MVLPKLAKVLQQSSSTWTDLLYKTHLRTHPIFSPVLHVTPVIGHEGGEVHIKCPYDHGSEVFPKRFYRRIRNTLEQPHMTLQRPFSLVDDTVARVFTVTIGGLTANDTAVYDCVIEKTPAVYRGHQVLVTERKCSTKSSVKVRN